MLLVNHDGSMCMINGGNVYTGGLVFTGVPATNYGYEYLSIVNGGFKVIEKNISGSYLFFNLNTNTQVYRYLAIV